MRADGLGRADAVLLAAELNVHEYQAKGLLREFGIPVPNGVPVFDLDDARRAVDAPATWAYLEKHRARLDARRSRVYRGRPPFSIFGVGPYAFAPFKVAVSGLHGRVAFAVVGPVAGRPVMLDDTCYFLPYADEPSARRAAAALSSPVVADFFRGRLFPDEKRPVTKALLQSLDLASIVRA